MSAHTPGPWHARQWQCRAVTSVGRISDNALGFEQIAECSANGRQVSTEQEEADARLIAAAPELLEALEDLIDAHAVPSTACKERGAYDKARAVIAKATGSTP
jgi:hypothetical protein